MSDIELLVFVDVESTGLLTDPTPPTILEASWTVTDAAGDQLTGVNHVFTSLRTQPGQEVHTPFLSRPAGTGQLVDPDADPEVTWWIGNQDDSYPIEAVRTMHAANGLAEEHARAGDLDTVVTSWGEIEIMIENDLLTAGWGGLDKRQVALAGGGVSHYEHRFLPRMAPRVFADPRFHYTAGIDVSAVLRALRTRFRAIEIPGTDDRLIEFARQQGVLPATYDPAATWAPPGLTVYGSDTFAGGDTDSAAWALRPGPDNHRSYVGVARSLTAYRLLPWLLTQGMHAVPRRTVTA